MSEKVKTEKSRARKIYDIVSTVIIALIFVFLVVVAALLLWQRKTGTDSAIFGYSLYNVLTDSMEPTINPGEIIISKRVDASEEIKVGDIITFVAPSGRLKGQNETHRVYDIVYNDDGSVKYIKTAGDNKYGTDTVKVDDWQLDRSAVKAKYVKTTKFISGLRDFLTKWYGYVVLIVIPLCVVFGLFIAGIVQDKVKLEKEKNKKEYIDTMSEEEKKRLAEEYLKEKEENPDKNE